MSRPDDDGDGAGAVKDAAPDDRSRPLLPQVAIGVMFLLTILGGVVLTPAGPGVDGGPVGDSPIDPRPPDPDNPDSFLNLLPLVLGALFGTVIVLAAVRFGGLRLVRGLFVLIFGYLIAQFAAGFVGLGLAFGLGGLAALLLVIYPEWYVLDAMAILAGAYIISEFGRFMSALPVLVLLVLFAVYDAYSVYGSEHMQSMVGGLGEMLVPTVYIVPLDRSFSLLDGTVDIESAPVALLGLGDAIFPGLLAVSGGYFLTAPPLLPGTALNLPALGAVLGSGVGFVGLTYLVFRVRRAHAGLPVLNACVIVGYLLGAVAAGVPLRTALGL